MIKNDAKIIVWDLDRPVPDLLKEDNFESSDLGQLVLNTTLNGDEEKTRDVIRKKSKISSAI